jgi:SM-20-related protein
MWNALITDLVERGFSVQKDLFDSTLLSSLQAKIAQAYSSGQLRQAAVASGTVTETRGDQIRWLEKEDTDFSAYLSVLEELKTCVNRDLFLGIRDIESHITVYPPSKKYEKHVDNFRGKNPRRLSCILYLNRNWSDENGGELVLYDQANRVLQTIQPELGTFVIFKSEDFPHEVRTCYRDRMSVTSWFRS